MHNLHPGANLHPGCKFSPRVYFWPCERCFKNLHPGANLLLHCTFELDQIYLHPGANCAYECQNAYFLYASIDDFDILQTFTVYDFVLNATKIIFKLFLSK